MKKILIDVIGLASLSALSYGAMLIYFPMVFLVPGCVGLIYAIAAGLR
jgi:hypothetical protein